MRKRLVLALASLTVPVAGFAAYAGASAEGPATAGPAADRAADLAPAAAQADVSLGNLHLYSVPVRTYDSRPASGLLGSDTGPITNTTRRVAIRVPATAVAAEVNLTATNTSAFGFMRAFSIGEVPAHSNLNWNAPGQSMANQITVPVTRAGVAQAGCTTSCLFEFEVETAGSADVVLDVVGYYNAA